MSDLSQFLRGDADSIARHLLPAGSYVAGGEWRCSGTNSPTGSPISVHVGPGQKQGVCGFWNETPAGGDLLDLYQLVNGCGPKQAIDWAKEWLGLEEAPATKNNLTNRKRSEIAAKKKERDQYDVESRAKRAASASTIWKASGKLEDQGATYLQSRGIDPSYAGQEVRFHRSLPHPSGNVFPALVARVSDVRGHGAGVWRIYVKPTGEDKAPVENPKLGLGSCLGGAVRIGGVWTEIGVAEGVETALACRQMIHKTTGRLIPVWSALSSSGLSGLILPPEVTRVMVFADNDPIKFRHGHIKLSAGMTAAESLVARLKEEGRMAQIEAPPVGMDWLDVLNSAQKRKITEEMPKAA